MVFSRYQCLHDPAQQDQAAPALTYNSLLYPGCMPLDCLKELQGACCVFTSEYDLLRNDANNLIYRLQLSGAYVDH